MKPTLTVKDLKDFINGTGSYANRSPLPDGTPIYLQRKKGPRTSWSIDHLDVRYCYPSDDNVYGLYLFIMFKQ